MKVSQMLKEEQIRLGRELLTKTSVPSELESIKFKDLVELSTAQKVFSRDNYVYSEDEDLLYDMLNFSVGLSRLWREYREKHEDAEPISVNRIIADYLVNMYGLEEVNRGGGA